MVSCFRPRLIENHGQVRLGMVSSLSVNPNVLVAMLILRVHIEHKPKSAVMTLNKLLIEPS